MKSLSKLLKSPYFQLICYLAGFFAFFVLLFFGNGLVWQMDQAKLEKQKLAFEREKEVTNLRNNIHNTVNEIIELNNQIYIREKADTLSAEELNLFKARYDLLVDNLNYYQLALSKLAEIKPYKFSMPNPLIKYFKSYPSAPTNLRVEYYNNSSFLFYNIETNIITFIGLITLLLFISVFFTRLHLMKKYKKLIYTYKKMERSGKAGV